MSTLCSPKTADMMKRRYIAVALLDILLASALGALLLCALIKLYLCLFVTVELAADMSSLLHRGRIAVEMLNERWSNIGIKRCGQVQLVNNNAAHTPSVVAYTAENVPADFDVKALPRSIVLMVWRCVLNNQQRIYRREVYFLGKTTRRNQNHRPITALFYKVLPGKRQALISSVADWQLEFTIVSPVGKMMTIPAVALMDQDVVKGIAYELLLRGNNPWYALPFSHYWFALNWHTARDRYLHQSWLGYVALQN